MVEFILVVYTLWAVFSGYKVLSGRSEWLDKFAPINLIVKLALSIVVGYFVAAFYLIYLILVFLGIMSRG